MTSKDLITLSSLCIMSLAHITSNRAGLLHAFEKRGGLSFGAGASVAYVFVHVFPEVGVFQHEITGQVGHHGPVLFVNQPFYLVALGGLCVLYLFDTVEERYQNDMPEKSQPHKYYHALFGVRCGLFVLYNIMIAYLVTQRHGEGIMNTLLITIGLMFHFLVTQISAREKYEGLAERYFRWPAAAGLLTGWVLAMIIELPQVLTVTVFSLIGGMITYIALKRELPQSGHKEPFHFIAGVVTYSLIVLTIPYFGSSHMGTH